MNPKLKIVEGQGIGAHSLAHNIIEGWKGVLELRDGTRKK